MRPFKPFPLAVFSTLLLALTTTRLHHFGVIPDASWAVFFVAGFYLNKHWRWAFPALMAAAIAVDYVVISASGLDFWSHYCVSPGYWFLLPAHFSLWAAGHWAARDGIRPSRALGLRVAGMLIAAVIVCHLFAQGGFYWFSAVVVEPTLAGWWKNFSDWLLPYGQVAALYVGIAAIVHVALYRLAERRADLARTA